MNISKRSFFGFTAGALVLAASPNASARTPYIGPMPYVPGPRDFTSMADFRIWDDAHREYEKRFAFPFAKLVMDHGQEGIDGSGQFWIDLEQIVRRTYKSKVSIIQCLSKQYANTSMFWIRVEHEGEPNTYSQMFLGKDDASRYDEQYRTFTVMET